MLEVIDEFSQQVGSPEAHQELLRHVRLTQVDSLAGKIIEADRQLLQLGSEDLMEK